MPFARVSSKGQITLPAELRRKLSIEPNSRVDIVLRDAEIVIRPLKTVSELKGILRDHVRGHERMSWDEERRRMEELVAREVEDE